jgi:subtilase family serine protease
MLSNKRRVVAALGAAALCVPLLAATVGGVPAAAHDGTRSGAHTSGAARADGRVKIAGTKAVWASRSRARGVVAAGTQLTFRVELKFRHAGRAEKAAVRASTPGHHRYGRFLTTKQFRSTFAPSRTTVRMVSHYFARQGFHVVSRDWHGVTLRGSAGAVSRTFDTSLRMYSVGGRLVRGADRQLSLPRAIGSKVLTVSGVNGATIGRRVNTVRQTERPVASVPQATPNSAFDTPPDCSNYWNQFQYTMPLAYGRTSFPTYICGYTPSQLRSAYGTSSLVSSGQTGKGTKVAIIDAYASPTMLADANTYATNRGDPTFKPGQYQEKVFGPFANQDICGGEEGWNGEETLDVEAVHAMAPGADVLYVGGSDCISGIDSAQQWIVDNAYNRHSPAYGVSIISNSYGNPGEDLNVAVDPAEFQLDHRIAIQSAIEGVGMYFSSGDEGDNVAAGVVTTPQPQYESSDPFVTGVGGTSLAVAQNGSYLFETGWGTALDPVTFDSAGNQTGYAEATPGEFLFGGGGGVSHLFSEPLYQYLAVPSGLARSYDHSPQRVAPDIAAVGDPYTGFLIGETVDGVYGESDIGGTSLSTPLMAGIQAVVQGNGQRIGFANPLIYILSGSAFHDIRPPALPVAVPSVSGHNLVSMDHDSTLFTATGYDDVTGRGTPNGLAFVNAERRWLR